MHSSARMVHSFTQVDVVDRNVKKMQRRCTMGPCCLAACMYEREINAPTHYTLVTLQYERTLIYCSKTCLLFCTLIIEYIRADRIDAVLSTYYKYIILDGKV